MADDCEYGTEDGWPPLGRTIPADPYDEDGYCEWCGNGAWKFHGPECAWADAHDGGAIPLAPSNETGADDG